ncbi:peroxiredoxin-like family protein [Terriglobus tenax]|uniref:peroxiredoxin-like family protein n=1 Tax=Terriglobus tenax TaxID=1111115 RepID=UPI0021DF4A5D|nr:peroxiredoxin-like family protein [Terriglobus tenax]
MDDRTIPSLQPQLDEITANTRRLVQAERLAINENAVAELFGTGIEDRILPVGSKAPEFSLPDAISGKPIQSADLLALGPLVINFFRGRWCPYCVTELETWRELYPTLRERGALLVAISPQTVRQSDFTVQQHALRFPLLWDQGAALADKFGVGYTPSTNMQQYYRSILVNIPFINTGQNALKPATDAAWRLPLPATFVVGQDGIIRFAEAHADFRVRPEPADVLAAL